MKREVEKHGEEMEGSVAGLTLLIAKKQIKWLTII